MEEYKKKEIRAGMVCCEKGDWRVNCLTCLWLIFVSSSSSSQVLSDRSVGAGGASTSAVCVRERRCGEGGGFGKWQAVSGHGDDKVDKQGLSPRAFLHTLFFGLVSSTCLQANMPIPHTYTHTHKPSRT